MDRETGASSIIYNTEDGQVAVYGTHCEAETCARWDAVFREGLTIYQVGWSLPSARAMGMQEFLDQTCVVWVAGLDVPECDSWAGALRLEEVYPGFY
ncbi:hypothetical protein [Naumannella halotolerans]|uniref:Uncharacterized protein n=1 Tax=Naumannella halotolerans TaxID=993414 RepID=A0A4R7J2A1_9ACTN|nr:hypothetical protein [Naumannella halotolerans]TDT31312.1 hypothetical protein CLV29_2728 [Naumannella halotolerans]